MQMRGGAMANRRAKLATWLSAKPATPIKTESSAGPEAILLGSGRVVAVACGVSGKKARGCKAASAEVHL